MLNYKDKPLEQLNFNECMEFEKELLKKVLGASRAGMGDRIVEQLNMYLSLVRMYKSEALQKELDAFKKEGGGDDGVSLDTGLDE